DRSGRRDSLQRRDHGAQGRPHLRQLRQRRTGAPPQHRSGEVDALGRAVRGRGARARHDQSREAAAHRRPRRSLEVGKDADVVIWNHHPLSTYAIADRVYIDGTVYYDRVSEDARLTALRKEKADLAAAEAGGRGRAVTGTDNRDDGVPSPTVDEVQGQSGFRLQAEDSRPANQPVATAGQSAANGPVWAIINAKIHPITQPTIERGTIVIRGSKIQAIGANVSVPSG